MKRAEGLVISRRDFCALAGLATLGACTDGGVGAIQTGPLGGGDDQAPDASKLVDAATPDGPGLPMCPATGATDVGAPSAFAMNTPVYISSGKFFVVRDAGGLYALTSLCTHEGAACVVSGQDFRCPRHGALFTFNGAIVSGPVTKPLKHYAMCMLANGHVGVTTATTVAATTRLAV